MENTQEKIWMGWVQFVYVEGGYVATREYRKLEYITTADSCYLSRVNNNKGNALTDTTKWICLASGAAATAAAQTCLERITELNRLLVQLSAAITNVEDASGVTAETRAALTDLNTKRAELADVEATLLALIADARNATKVAQDAYALVQQGGDVMSTKPAMMVLMYEAEAPLGAKVKVKAMLKPETANQSVVFVPVGGAVVSPDGVVQSPAEAGDVTFYVVSTEVSQVWKEVTIHFRALSQLMQDDDTVLTQDDDTVLNV